MSSTLKQKIFDVIIVGMGPAGSTAARKMSQAGLSVLGLEKGRHPRYKVCGGALSARIDPFLAYEYQSVVERTIHTVQFTYGGHGAFRVQSSSPIVYMVMREHFDHLLLDWAKDTGTCVREGEQVREVRELDDRVTVSTTEGCYQGRVVIGADGANSVVARCLFQDLHRKKLPALESEIFTGNAPSYPDTGELMIDFGIKGNGYGWVFPKEEGLSVGVAEFYGSKKKPKGIFHSFVSTEKGLKSLSVPAPVGHPIPVYRRGMNQTKGGSMLGLVQKRALLVGDAASLVDPIFGEGIYYAVRSGHFAAETILQAFSDSRPTFQEYEMQVSQELIPELRLASRLVRLVYACPRWCQRILGSPFPSFFQELLELYCHKLQGTETHHSFISKAGNLLVKSPFKALYS